VRTFLAATVLGLALAACNRSAPSAPPQSRIDPALVGVWWYPGKTFQNKSGMGVLISSAQLALNADATAYVTGGDVGTAATWTADGKVLRYTLHDGKSYSYPYSLAGDKLTLAEDSGPIEFSRLAPRDACADVDAAAVRHEERLEPSTDYKEAVRLVIRRHLVDLKNCVEANLPLEGSPRNTVLTFTITRSGKMRDRKVISAETEKLTKCLREATVGWTFPPPPEGKEYPVWYPLTFDISRD
jgi:hypothetical protein